MSLAVADGSVLKAWTEVTAHDSADVNISAPLRKWTIGGSGGARRCAASYRHRASSVLAGARVDRAVQRDRQNAQKLKRSSSKKNAVVARTTGHELPWPQTASSFVFGFVLV